MPTCTASGLKKALDTGEQTSGVFVCRSCGKTLKLRSGAWERRDKNGEVRIPPHTTVVQRFAPKQESGQ